MSELVLQLAGIARTFEQGKSRLAVLRGVNFKVHAGEIVALVGPSGAGKSTLLHVAGLLEKPDEGEVVIDGQACGGMSDDERTKTRRHRLGFVYQYHHLLPEFSALENVMVPQIIAGVPREQAREQARELLACLGLKEREDHRPARLSGGEQQRVAIARAVANVPKVVLADEPTGNLDPDTAGEVFAMLMRLARGANLAAVIATHNPDLAQRMDRLVRLEHGVLVEGTGR
jgi:lipoprotein-releasing system ATP-binding protein